MSDVLHKIGEVVAVRFSNRTERVGRVFGYEDGRHLHKFGANPVGPFSGIAYHVRLSGNDGASEDVIVDEADVFSLTED